jgi:hypothetical protein
MPKRGPNPKKLAAAKIKNLTAVDEAAGGKYEIGQVTHCNGFKNFTIKIVGVAAPRVVSITSKLFQGGQHSAHFVQREDWLIVDDREVVGVINAKNRDAFEQLQSAGRIPLEVKMKGLEEFFEMEEDDEDKKAADATWDEKEAKSLREGELMKLRQQQGDELAARILAKRRGLAAGGAALPLVGRAEHERDDVDLFGAGIVDDEGLSPEEDGEDGGAGGGDGGARRQITSKRRLAAIAAREAAEAAAAVTEEERAARAAMEAYYAAEAEREAREAVAEAEFAAMSSKMAAAADWESFIDNI